jgi:AcrR family transcriptional regulator
MLKSARGRPPLELAKKKRAHLLKVAFDEFVRKGFHGASIDGIATLAGFSRTTIYALYSDKETLFREVVSHSADRYATHFLDLASDRRAPDIVLKETAKKMYRHFMTTPNRNMLRLCIAECESFPDLARQVRETMLSHAFTGLRGYFESLHAEGVADIRDSAAAVTLFNVMTLGSLKPLLIPTSKYDAREAARIEWSVDVFMNGCFLRKK